MQSAQGQKPTRTAYKTLRLSRSQKKPKTGEKEIGGGVGYIKKERPKMRRLWVEI